jgi:hypothetical protein
MRINSRSVWTCDTALLVVASGYASSSRLVSPAHPVAIDCAHL